MGIKALVVLHETTSITQEKDAKKDDDVLLHECPFSHIVTAGALQ